MKQLVEKRKELEAKQAELAKVFEQAGTDLDFDKVTCLGDNLSTVQKAAKVQERNKELADLGKEVEQLALVEKAHADQKGRDALLNSRPTGITHPGANGNGNSQGNGNQQKPWKSLGDMFIESDTFRMFKGRRGPETQINLDDFGLEAKDLLGASHGFKTLLDRTGFVPESTRIPVLLPGQLRRPVVSDLIPQGTTSMGIIKYMEETTTTNSAAAVAEGGQKPESALAFTEKTSLVEKLATVLPVTDELMADAPAMRSYIEARLRLFLQLVEEDALIRGSGTTPALRGMLNVATINTQAKGSDPTPDAIYKGMQKIRTTSFLEPSGVIIHPDDWTDIRLLRTADGVYIWGSPQDPGMERIWGLPVVVTPAMTTDGTTTGTAIVAAFDTGMQIFRRNEVSFAVSDQHSDFFIYNKLMLRVEERLAFVVYRPKAICTVTGI